MKKGVVVAPRAIEIPAAAQHFSICQVHPNILLKVAHLTPPATTEVKEGMFHDVNKNGKKISTILVYSVHTPAAVM